jgi:hypothetical protein
VNDMTHVIGRQVFCRWELYCSEAAYMPQAWLHLAARVRDQIAAVRQTKSSLKDLLMHCGVRAVSPRTVLMMRRAGLQSPVVLHCMCVDAASCSDAALCVCRREQRKCTAHCHPVSRACANCDSSVRAYDTVGFPPPRPAKTSHKKGGNVLIPDW